MSKTQLQPGDIVDLVAPADVLSGAGVKVGQIFGVAQEDALSGVTVACARVGVHTLPKDNADAFTQGQLAYWDDTAKEVKNNSGAARLIIGVAAAAIADTATTGAFLLDGTSRADQAS